MRYYAYLNTGLTIVYNGDEVTAKEGLRDLLVEELGEEPTLYPIAHCTGKHFEFAFAHTNKYGENYFSFVNGQYTNDGGTHQSAFREGVLKGINAFAGKNFAGEDVRDGLIGAVAIKLQEPVFESQTKNKLGSTEVRGWLVAAVKDEVERWLHSDAKVAENLIAKVKANEKLRKELSAVKKKPANGPRKQLSAFPN